MWRIITDSSGRIPLDVKTSENLDFDRVPFIIDVDGIGYIDDESLDEARLVGAIDASAEPGQTACPSPEKWMSLFETADEIIAVTISENLSGSYQSALMAKHMTLEKYPEKKICIINSKSAGSALTMTVKKAAELISEGLPFETVTTEVTAYADSLKTVFALCSFKNLIKNGRVSRLAGFMAGKLHLWGIGIASPIGTIIVKSKVRGLRGAVNAIIDDMKENSYSHGNVLISHCLNEPAALELKTAIVSAFENAKVDIISTGGLCSFYAEHGGLIVAYGKD